jgi:hypothetical protein
MQAAEWATLLAVMGRRRPVVVSVYAQLKGIAEAGLQFQGDFVDRSWRGGPHERVKGEIDDRRQGKDHERALKRPTR